MIQPPNTSPLTFTSAGCPRPARSGGACTLDRPSLSQRRPPRPLTRCAPAGTSRGPEVLESHLNQLDFHVQRRCPGPVDDRPIPARATSRLLRTGPAGSRNLPRMTQWPAHGDVGRLHAGRGLAGMGSDGHERIRFAKLAAAKEPPALIWRQPLLIHFYKCVRMQP
jgi:hypothetical protein